MAAAKGTGVRFCGLNCAWLQPTLVLLVVLFVYCVYVGLHLLPSLQLLNASSAADMLESGGAFLSSNASFQRFLSDPHATRMSFSWFVSCTLVFHLLLILFALAFVKAIVTPPGSVPVQTQADKKKWDDGLFDLSPADDARIEEITLDQKTDLADQEVRTFIRNCILVERKKEAGRGGGLKRHCKSCQIFKPDRTHHCKVCGHCVLRMDHHCPWVANCIGFRNYKFFLLILFYCILLTLWVLLTMGARFGAVFLPVLDSEMFWKVDLPIAVAYAISALVFVGLSLFFAGHVWMATHALTSIERAEKRSSDNVEVTHRFNISHIKFDRGAYDNWKHVMGDSPTSWFFPVDANPLDDGTYSHAHIHDVNKER